MKCTVLAKPKSGTNPRNSVLYGILEEKFNFEVTRFTSYKLLFTKYDLLHIHWPDRIFYWKLPSLIALFLLYSTLGIAHSRGAKIIYTCHNFIPKNRVSDFNLRLYYFILKKYVDGVICPRFDLIDSVERKFAKATVRHIPLGILPKAKYRDESILEIIGNKDLMAKCILVPGIQESTKKTEMSIDALLSKDGDTLVLIVGAFPSEDYYGYMKERYSNYPNVKIDNRYLSESELATLLEDCKCVLASQIDGTNSGIALLALAYDKVCLCATPGIAHSVSSDYDTNMVIPLADYLVDSSVLDDLYVIEKDSLSARKFSMEVVAETTSKFYLEIIA